MKMKKAMIFLVLVAVVALGCAYERSSVRVYGSGKGIIMRYHHIVKVLNGLRYDVEVRTEGRQIPLAPGQEAQIGYSQQRYDDGGSGRRVVLTAAVLENGKIIGTATRTVHISMRPGEEVWHITSFTPLR
jgi:hypothetical protein